MSAADIEAFAAVVAAVATIATALIALWALAASYRTYRASYQPLVRPVVAEEAGLIILKNVGRGTALSVTVARRPADRGADLLADVDVVEPLGAPLGPSFLESRRIGRVTLRTTASPARIPVGEYSIFYQDSAGAWHQTDFSVTMAASGTEQFETKFRGRCSPWWLLPVPAWIQVRRQVAANDLFQ